MKKLSILFISLLSILYAENKIIIGDAHTIASLYVRDYIIKGNGETCKLTYFIDDKYLLRSTCLTLTNSKGIEIFCTKGKKACKTEKEIVDLFTNKNEKQAVLSKYENIKQSPPEMKRIFGQAEYNTQVEVDEVVVPPDGSSESPGGEVSQTNSEHMKRCAEGAIQYCKLLSSIGYEDYYIAAYRALDRSCNSGVEDACYKLANFYIYGVGEIKKNNYSANELLQQACRGGHVYACGDLHKRAKLFYIHTPQKSHLVDEYNTCQKNFSVCVSFHDLDSMRELEYCGDFKIDFANKKSVEEAEKTKQKQSAEERIIASNKKLSFALSLGKAIANAKYACSKGGVHKGYLVNREPLGFNFSKKKYVYRSTYKCIKCESTYVITR